MIRFKLPNGSSLYVDANDMQFVCPTCTAEGGVRVQTKMSFMKTSSTSFQSTTQSNASITDITAVLKAELDARVGELKTHMNENNDKCIKTVNDVMNNLNNNMKFIATTRSDKLNTKEFIGRTPQKNLYSTILKKAMGTNTTTTPVTGKREREKTNPNEIVLIDNKTSKTISTVKIPTPKHGTKDVVIGEKPKLSSPQLQRRSNMNMLNRLNKSIRVAGLHPSVTVEKLTEYIAQNTPITEKSKFHCRLLVKKEQDLEMLSFVSFKVDVAAEDFTTLMNLEHWPDYVSIREFIRVEKPKQGEPFLQLPTSMRKIQRLNDSAVDRSTTKINQNADKGTTIELMDSEN